MTNLSKILSIQSSSYEQFRMFAYIIRQVAAMDGVSYGVDNGNIYITKGESDTYPCIVAHMDTVHDIVEDLTPIEIDGKITGFNRVTMEQVGIGGDDKVGIYIALRVLEQLDAVKVVFFRDEEVGCHGSYLAVPEFFDDCRFVLQCDRRGNSDFITNGAGTDLSSVEFQEDIAPIIHRYGYSFTHGSITDVVALKESDINISMANISCGYYNPHSETEYVVVDDVENCLDMVLHIMSVLEYTYPHKYKPRKTWSSKPNYDEWDWAPVGESKEKTQYKLDNGYCMDCWAKPADDSGLCSDCLEYYSTIK